MAILNNLAFACFAVSVMIEVFNPKNKELEDLFKLIAHSYKFDPVFLLSNIRWIIYLPIVVPIIAIFRPVSLLVFLYLLLTRYLRLVIIGIKVAASIRIGGFVQSLTTHNDVIQEFLSGIVILGVFLMISFPSK